MNALPRITRRESAIAGWGVYAGQTIEEDTRVAEYKGALIPQAEAWARRTAVSAARANLDLQHQ